MTIEEKDLQPKIINSVQEFASYKLNIEPWIDNLIKSVKDLIESNHRYADEIKELYTKNKTLREKLEKMRDKQREAGWILEGAGRMPETIEKRISRIESMISGFDVLQPIARAIQRQLDNMNDYDD